MTPWRDAPFLDEAAERQLLGCLVLYPERLRELRVGRRHFHSRRVELFDLLIAHGFPLTEKFWKAAIAGRVAVLAWNCFEEWNACGWSFEELQRILLRCERRRRYRLVAEALAELSEDVDLADDEIERARVHLIVGFVVDEPMKSSTAEGMAA